MLLTARRFRVLFLLMAGTGSASAQASTRISDARFWNILTDLSEPTGTFPSENLTSNEASYQTIIPGLLNSGRRGGAYIGVGPEQNFSYIAALQPRIAFLIDIRRQALQQHLLYKALFELAPNRREFLSLLFSRRASAKLTDKSSPYEMIVAFDELPIDSLLYQKTLARVVRQLRVVHHFALTDSDVTGIQHVLQVFRDAGLRVSYSYPLLAMAPPLLPGQTATRQLPPVFQLFHDGSWSDSSIIRSITQMPERSDTAWAVNGHVMKVPGGIDPISLLASRIRPGFLDGNSFLRPLGIIDFATLMIQTDSAGVMHSFLASEQRYRYVREMHLDNLIIPVVGDFAGSRALMGIGGVIRAEHLTVSAFYVSNVEQYLFEANLWRPFFENVGTLPLDSGSTFIRSFFSSGFSPVKVRGASPSTSTYGSMMAVVSAFRYGMINRYGDLLAFSKQ